MIWVNRQLFNERRRRRQKQKERVARYARKFVKGAGNTAVNVKKKKAGTGKMLVLSVDIFRFSARNVWLEILLNLKSV